LFFDGPFPVQYHDLVSGRAVAVGPDDQALAGADAVIAGARRHWDRAALAGAASVRVVSRIGVGYDNVDVADLALGGVVVCNTPEAPTVSTAEHTMMLMLAITKSLPVQLDRAGRGLRADEAVGLELDHAALGLLGFGRIARRVAHAAQALGMYVIAHDPFVEPEQCNVELVEFEDMLERSDVLSLHAPATVDTEQIMGRSAFERMKRGAFLVNCARGSLVDQSALLACLDSGALAGAALDVTVPEPLPAGHPLLEHPQVIVTPHVASATVAGRHRLYDQAIENAIAVLQGRPASVVVAEHRT
jgi:phosphoglycerate dehydrogenase-like enzyme